MTSAAIFKQKLKGFPDTGQLPGFSTPVIYLPTEKAPTEKKHLSPGQLEPHVTLQCRQCAKDE